MKTIYLLPYEFDASSGAYKRKRFGTNIVYASVWSSNYSLAFGRQTSRRIDGPAIWYTSHLPSTFKFSSYESCTSFLDKHLSEIKEVNYVFISKEKAEKLQVLL
jgi:hypothetical protein